MVFPDVSDVQNPDIAHRTCKSEYMCVGGEEVVESASEAFEQDAAGEIIFHTRSQNDHCLPASARG